MGKVLHDNTDSDSSNDERKKNVREERKIRTKKKKRKRDLTDLHQRLSKPKKNKETKINGKLEKARNSKRICNRILPRPLNGIYRNGATGKEIRRSQTNLSLSESNNARLQGNVRKLLQGYDTKSKSIVIENNAKGGCKEPLLDSAIRNILLPTPPGEGCPSPVLGKVDGKKRCQKNECIETVELSKNNGLLQKSSEKDKPQKSESFRRAAKARYQELCVTVSSENFEKRNPLDQFIKDPLIAVKKKLRSLYAESIRSQALRDMMIRDTVLNECESSHVSTENDVISKIPYCPSGFGENSETVSVTAENPNYWMRTRNGEKEKSLQERQNPFLIPEAGFSLNGKRNQISSSHLLFDFSSLDKANNRKIKNIIESEQIKNMNDIESDKDLSETSRQIYSSLEVNHFNTSTRKNENTKYFEDSTVTRVNRTERAEEQSRNKPVLFFRNEAKIPKVITAKRRLIKSKNQHTQTMNLLSTAVKKHSGRHASKAAQEIKTKNLKHIPAILRRRNNTAIINEQLNIFDELNSAVEEPQETLVRSKLKENVLFTPGSLITKSNGNSKRLDPAVAANAILNNVGTRDIDVQTCVIASPNLHNDEVRFIKNSCLQMDSKQQSQNVNIGNIFSQNSKRNPSIQKTIMFTKKESRNIGHCSHINNLISGGTTESSNVYLMRKSVPQQHEKSMRNVCIAHRSCQRTSGNCYGSFHCSQSSDGFNESSQQFKDPHVQEESAIYEKVLSRRVQQHPKCGNNHKCHNKDEKVCYVVVDQCKDLSSSPNCAIDNRPTKPENCRTFQHIRCCQQDIGDVGILKGVQNLQILPMEERDSPVSLTNSQCIGNTVLVEEQPIKYLAFENNSKAHRMPIYVQKNVTSADNAKLISPKVNYRVVSRPKESDQEIILVPAREPNNVVYLKQQDLNHSNISYERYSEPKKVVFYRPENQPNTQRVKTSSNLCEIHASNKNIIGIRNTECEGIAINLQKAEDVKQFKRDSVNWEEMPYRLSHEHRIANDGYVRNQALFYQK